MAGGAAAVGHEAVQRVALEAQAPIEGGSNVAGLERAGEDLSGRGVHRFESSVADPVSWQLLLQPKGQAGWMRHSLGK